MVDIVEVSKFSPRTLFYPSGSHYSTNTPYSFLTVREVSVSLTSRHLNTNSVLRWDLTQICLDSRQGSRSQSISFSVSDFVVYFRECVV